MRPARDDVEIGILPGGVRHEDLRQPAVPEPVHLHVSDDADDFYPRSVADGPREQQPMTEGGLVRPHLIGQLLIDDDHGPVVVVDGEEAAGDQRYSQRFKEAGECNRSGRGVLRIVGSSLPPFEGPP